MKAKPTWSLGSQWCHIGEEDGNTCKGKSTTCVWCKAIISALKLCLKWRKLRNTYSEMSPSQVKVSPSFFHHQISQLYHKFGTAIKTRRTDPGGKNQSTSPSHNMRKASDIWKENPLGGGELYIMCIIYNKAKWMKLQSRETQKSLSGVRDSNIKMCLFIQFGFGKPSTCQAVGGDYKARWMWSLPSHHLQSVQLHL